MKWLRRYQRIAIGLISALVISLLVNLCVVLIPPSSAATSFTGCPDSWNVNLPPLMLREHNKITESGPTAGLPYQYFTSSYGNFGSPGSSHISPDLKWIAPELSTFLSSLGRDVVYSTFYETSPDKEFLTPSVGTWPGAYFPLSSLTARTNYGIGSSTWIRAVVKIYINGCPQTDLFSNAVQFHTLDEKLINLDEFFSHTSTYFNFIQENEIRDLIKTNLEILGTPLKENVPLQMKRLPTGFSSSNRSSLHWYPISLDSSGCAIPINRGSIPPIDPITISFRTTPCKVGFMIYPGVAVPKVDLFSICLIEKIQATAEQIKSLGLPWNCNNPSRSDLSKPSSAEDALKTIPSSIITGYFVGTVMVTRAIQVPQQGTPSALPSSTPTATPKVTATAKPIPKKISIVCVKGELTRKVTATNPVCPSGYKKK